MKENIIFIIVSIVLITIIIIQSGKICEISYSLRSGAYRNFFCSGSVMNRITAFFAAIFLLMSLTLDNIINTKIYTNNFHKIEYNINKEKIKNSKKDH